VRVIGTHFVVARAGDAVGVDVQRGEVEVTSGGVRALVPAGSRWPPSAAAADGAETPSSPASLSPTSLSPASPSPAASESAREPWARPASGPAARSSAASPRELYEAASRLEAAQPGAAVALYRELAHQGGAWGENALFGAGRLEADRGDHDDARRLLRDYLARYPGGPNANDARQLLDRLR